jgi:hypothetical protein
MYRGAHAAPDCYGQARHGHANGREFAAMKNGVRRRSRTFGLAACVVGLLALLAVAIPQWAAPQPDPAPINTHFSWKERIAGKLKDFAGRRHERHERIAEPLGWEQRFPLATILLALFALALATFSIVWGEEPLFGGIAVALGISAIAFQLTILFAVVIAAILILYAVLGEPDGAVTLAIVAVCAIAVMAALAILGMGAGSTLLLIAVAVAILALNILQG